MRTLLSPAALAAAALALTGAAQAEIKTDGLWRGSGGAALSATSGNSTTTSLLLSAEGLRATTTDKITLGAAANYARNKAAGITTTTANKWGGFGQYDFNLGPRTFAFGRLALDADELIDLNLRTAVAAGLGYRLIDTKPTTFEIFGGAGYTTDKYDTVQTIGSKTGKSFSRASVYLGESSTHQLTASTTFKQRLDLYPGLSGDKAVIAKFSAGLGVAMSTTMQLTVGLTDTYNSKPPAGSKKNDVALFTGVNVKFGAN